MLKTVTINIRTMKNLHYYLAGLAFAFVFMPAAASAVVLEDVCPVTLDNDTSDWAEVEPLYSTVGETIGVDYYWVEDQWYIEEPEEYEYSTNVDQMATMENIKMCNTITAMYLYVDAQHPMFAVWNTEEEIYHEFPWDEEEPIMGMPQEYDNWMVFHMQKEGSSNLYFYAIHLYSEVGDLGLTAGPTTIAIYEDDGDTWFNPNSDEMLVEFETSDESLYEGIDDEDFEGKSFDQDGGMEVGMFLVNADGEGLFTVTDISYGDTIDITGVVYPNSLYAATASIAGATQMTDTFEYTIAEVGVQGLKNLKNKRKRKQATLKWSAVTGATKYYVKYKRRKSGAEWKTVKTTNVKKTLKNLKAGKKKYKAKVRAKVGGVFTPWSDLVNFKTKKKKNS